MATNHDFAIAQSSFMQINLKRTSYKQNIVEVIFFQNFNDGLNQVASATTVFFVLALTQSFLN
jgi:hypothetical protein